MNYRQCEVRNEKVRPLQHAYIFQVTLCPRRHSTDYKNIRRSSESRPPVKPVGPINYAVGLTAKNRIELKDSSLPTTIWSDWEILYDPNIAVG